MRQWYNREMEHYATANLTTSSNLTATATVIVSGSASLTARSTAYMVGGIVLPPSRIVGSVLPPPLEIDVQDSIPVRDSTDAKVTEGELPTYLKELNELSKRSQQLIVVWIDENPVLAPVFIFILCQVMIQLIDAIFSNGP